MANELTVGVVVLTLNGGRFIEPLARSIFAQTHPADRIIVVDNGSDDGTVDLIKEHFLPLGANVVLNEKNTGCAGGYNQGANTLEELDIVVFLNQDVVLDSKYLESIRGSFRSEDIVATQPLVLYYDRPDVIENCGHICDKWITTRTIAHETHLNRMALPSQAALFTLTAPAVRMSAFREEGGFDEHLFVYYEDTDLSLRLIRRGGRIAFNPDAIVYHDTESASKSFSKPWKRFLWTRNRLFLLWRHSSGLSGAFRGTMAVLVFLVLGVCLIAVDPAQGRATLRGVTAALGDVNRISQQRKIDTRTFGLTLSQLSDIGAISDGITANSVIAFLRSRHANG